MTSSMVAERMRLGRANGPAVGVLIKADRRDLPAVGAIVDDLLAYAQVRLAKARLPRAVQAREDATAEIRPAFRDALAEYFGGLLRRAEIRKDVADDIDWPGERRELGRVLRRFYGLLGDAAYAAFGGEVGLEIAFDLEAPATEAIRDRLALHVKAITETTRELIRDYTTTATDRGYSIEQLVEGVDGDGFLGLEAIFGSRADTIALTETANAYNLASAASWRESGLVERVVIFDGPDCGWTEHDDPDLADGSTRTLDEFEETPIGHPNCQRAAGPVVAE